MHQVRQGEFEHEGFRLAYEEHGEPQGVPLLLMHGILLDAAVNRDLCGPLVDAGYRVILLDLLGHGRSDRADATELRNDHFAEQVIGCLDHLKIERAVVGGLSLGAIVALHVACASPQRVRALLLEMPVMEHSTVFAALLLAPIIALVDWAPNAQRWLARGLRKLPRPRRGIWQAGLNAATQEPEAIKAVLHGILVGSVVPPRRQRRKITAPTLIIGHAGDWLHNMEDSRALTHEIPGAKLLEARSIFELRTKPQRLMPQILEFLQQATASGAAGADVMAAPGAPVPGTLPATAPEVVVAHEAPDLAARFDAAVQKVRSAPASGGYKPSNEAKLRMYALYRQARDGDVSGERPGMMDPVGRFKHDAWAALKGTSRDDAMRQYIGEVERVERKAG